MKRIFVFVIVIMAAATVSFAENYQGKKVLFINSYHEGYTWSDGITKGVRATLDGKGIDLKIIRLDMIRNSSEEFKQQAALNAKAVIEAFKPDVVIASDDNASKYLIVPYFKDTKIPFVFCGINWDASVYGFPCSNVTGMIEVNDIVGLVNYLKKLSLGNKVGFIADDTLTNRKEVENYKKLFDIDVDAVFPKNFDEWKKEFIEIQKRVDHLIFYNFIAIDGWNPKEALTFVRNHTKIPTGTMQDDPMPYVLIGFLKVPEEQGIWAAKTALKILDGASPSAIPISRNQQGKLMVNLRIAEKIGVNIPYDLIQIADKVIQ
ncbi:MAG: hypothetical protein BWK80_60070 [Desulfobacteraceae bacterium IS3]|nr:MAG: hypothetical protein BWK80_60070 [Desulfobacteraceae bacterium IS3]HAO23303.1 hypothetical protein [Desulfobacteraceae bacterium]